MTIEEIIKQKKAQGMTAIEIQKYLRENNMIVSFTEVRMIYNRV
jgi:arginine/lysine/ornithine decarboxylase